MLPHKTAKIFAFGCLLFAAVAPYCCWAAGYAILEQSAEGNAVAYAGATAGYADGSAVFFNPAAMSRSEQTLVSAYAGVVLPRAKFSNNGSYAGQSHAALSGDDGPNGGVNIAIPALYTIIPTSSELTLGLGFNVPFGLKTQYSDSWVGRYSAIKSELEVYSLSPAVSYSVTDSFSLGVAVNVVHADAKISNAIDFGTIGVASLGSEQATSLGLAPQKSDGYGRVSGDDWGVGATVGLSYAYASDSRLGLSYRSPIRLTFRGDADFDVPSNAQVLTTTGSFVDTDATSKITLPDSIALGVIHAVGEDWNILADIQWTHWAWFDELRVDYSSTQPDSVVDENWDNTWRYSFGTQFLPDDDIKLSAGFSYDQDPISDRYHRTAQLPGNDRYWLSCGAAYQLKQDVWLDLSYAHLFVADAKSEVTGATGDVLQGSWDLGADIVSAQVRMTF